MAYKSDLVDAERIFEYYKSNLSLDFEKGRLKLDDNSLILARAELLYDIFNELYTIIGKTVHSLIYRIAKPYGVNFVKWLESSAKERGDTLTREDVLKFVCSENPAIGWGWIEISEEEGKVIITSRKGFPVGQIYRDKKKNPKMAVDTYFLGYFEGIFSQLDNCSYKSTEELCIGKGDSMCRLVLEKV